MTEQPDTATMTGAEFRRHVGTDPAKWAEAFWQAFDRDGDRADHAGTVAFLAHWLRDFADACVAEAVRHETAAITGSQQQPPSQ